MALWWRGCRRFARGYVWRLGFAEMIFFQEGSGGVEPSTRTEAEWHGSALCQRVNVPRMRRFRKCE